MKILPVISVSVVVFFNIIINDIKSVNVSFLDLVFQMAPLWVPCEQFACSVMTADPDHPESAVELVAVAEMWKSLMTAVKEIELAAVEPSAAAVSRCFASSNEEEPTS